MYGSGIPKDDACFIDSSIALARSSSSLETLTECSFDSFSDRAIARARASSSSRADVCSALFPDLVGEPVGIRDDDAA